MSVRDAARSLTKGARGDPSYTIGEEVGNAVTHGFGALLALAGTVLMVLKSAGSPVSMAACAIYGISMFLSMLASTLYHGIQHAKAKRVLRIIDHSAIYAFIAGSYTPFCVIALGGWLGYGLLVGIWTVAVAGVVFKSIWMARIPILSVILYIAMGWIVVVVILPLQGMLEPDALLLLFAGGVMYTAGASLMVFRSVRHHHTAWHFFVLAGAALHFACVYWYVL